ncbi:MAG: hypothetical protein WBF49_05035, partial [Methyloceanibacter sp.]
MAVDLNSKTCAGTSFPRGRAAAVQRAATGTSRRKDFRSVLPLPKYKAGVYHLYKVNNRDKARQDSPGSR